MVKNRKTGELLAGANITIAGSQRGTSTDNMGQYRIHLEPGSYKLIASFVGFKKDTLSVTIQNKNISNQNFLLQPTKNTLKGITVHGNPLERRVRNLAKKRDEKRKKLKNYSVWVHKLDLLYQARSSKEKNLSADTSNAVAFSESVLMQRYIAPRLFGRKYIAQRSSKNFSAQYDPFTTGGSPLNINSDRVNLDILSEVVTVVGPISEKAPRFYNLTRKPAGPSWPDSTTKIMIKPKTSKKPLFKGSVFIDDKTDHVIGINLKLNEAGNVHSGVYSLSNFHYQQKYQKVQDYWLPAKTVIEGHLSSFIFKHDFTYRSTLNYQRYKINRPDLHKDDIPLSGKQTVKGANQRDAAYWRKVLHQNVSKQDIRAVQSTRHSHHTGFLLNLILKSSKIYNKAGPFLKHRYISNVSDFYRFNRVEGSYIGIGLRTPAVWKKYNYQAAVGYATEANDLRYHISGVQRVPGTPLSVEGSVYNKLAVQFGDYRYKVGPLNVGRFQQTIINLAGGHDSKNYFQRKGFEAGLRWNFRENFFLRADYMREDQHYLPVVAPHSIYAHYKVGGNTIDPNLNPNVGITPDGKVGPDNLEGFTEGQFAGFSFQFHFDNRQYNREVFFRDYSIRKFGWYIDNTVHWADPEFGNGGNDEFKYVKYRSAFGFRIPLFTSQFIFPRIYIGGTSDPLPAQRQFGSNGFYVENYLRRRPFLTLGFNEGVGNRVTIASVKYDLGSGFRRIFPFQFIRQSGIQLKLWGAIGYRHPQAGLLPVTPWTNGRQEQAEVGFAITRIFGIFSLQASYRLRGTAGDNVGFKFLF